METLTCWTSCMGPPPLRAQAMDMATAAMAIGNRILRAAPPLDLRAEAVLLRAELGRELLAEVVGLEHRPDLDLGAAVEGRALQPLHGLLHVLHLPQPEAGDQLLGLGERPVDH